jgi:hypothetical protein
MGGALLAMKKIDAQPKVSSRDSKAKNRTGGSDSLAMNTTRRKRNQASRNTGGNSAQI